MKLLKYFAYAMLFAAPFVACSDDDDDASAPAVASITLDKDELTLAPTENATLVATTDPADVAVEWESSNEEIAVVTNGKVIALAEGTAIITAKVAEKSAICVVTVKTTTGNEDPEPSPAPSPAPTPSTESLNGSEYFIFQLDGISSEKIASKIVADFRVDEVSKFLYIWENTYAAGDATGKNFYGEAEGWVSLNVGSVGWSGFAYNCSDLEALNKLAAIQANPQDYYFHIAVKSTSPASHLLFLDGFGGTSAKIAIGGDFTDNGVVYKSKADFTRDGEWNEIEICMKDAMDAGLIYSNAFTEGINILGALSGGVAGTNLQFDAAFIYKK